MCDSFNNKIMVKKIIGVLLVLYSSVMLFVLFMSNKSNKGLAFLSIIGLLILGIYLLRKNGVKQVQINLDNLSEDQREDWYEKEYERMVDKDPTLPSKLEGDYWRKFDKMYHEDTDEETRKKIEESITPYERIAHFGTRKSIEWRKNLFEKEKEKERLNYEKRYNRYIETYDEETSIKLANEEIWIGMTSEMLELVKGEPESVSNNVVRGKVKVVNYYDRTKNRQGNDAYGFEVTLENDVVVGWKDRVNRGTKG